METISNTTLARLTTKELEDLIQRARQILELKEKQQRLEEELAQTHHALEELCGEETTSDVIQTTSEIIPTTSEIIPTKSEIIPTTSEIIPTKSEIIPTETETQSEDEEEGLVYREEESLLDYDPEREDPITFNSRTPRPPMDTTGLPSSHIEQAGNLKAHVKDTYPDPPETRVISPNGCAPTLTHQQRVKILVSNEVPTRAIPEVVYADGKDEETED